MTDTEIDRELEDLLRESLHAIAAATPVSDLAGRARRTRRTVVAVAAVAVTIAGAAGVTAVVDRNGTTSPATTPSTSLTTVVVGPEAAVLLAPSSNLPRLHVADATHVAQQRFYFEGAALAPDGAVVGVTVQESPMPFATGGGVPDGEERWIGDVLVTGGLAEGAESGNETYVLTADCVMVAITTSHGLERWASEVTAFVESMAFAEGEVTVSLPAAWQSLGAGHFEAQYGMSFTVNLDSEEDSEFILSMRPETSIGTWLAYPGHEAPHQATMDGQRVWLVGETGGGWRTLVFDHRGTAVQLSGLNVTDTELLTMATNLVEQPWETTEEMVPSTTISPAGAATSIAFAETESPTGTGEAACPVSLTITAAR